MAVSIYIPTNSARGFPFLHTLSSIYCCRLFDVRHSDWCKVISHCGFDLHFSNNEPEEPEIKLPTSAGSWKKQESSRKTSISALLTIPKPLLCGSQQSVENSERDGNTRPPDLPLEKPIGRSGSNSSNWTWNNRLVPNRKRSTSRLYIVTLLI